jgi:hypothetical protein
MALQINDVAPDPVLTEIALEYGTGGSFAQDQILPTRVVARKSFKYMTWAMRDFIQGSQFDSRRAPGDTAKRAITPEGTWSTGAVNERTLKDALPDEILDNVANNAQYEAAIVKKLTNSLKLEIEIELQAAMNDTSNISNAAASVAWDNASAVIEKNIDTARELFVAQCGFEPNVIVLPPVVAAAVKRDSEIQELRKHTEANLVTDNRLPAKLFGLTVIEPGAIEDSENPGASASIARVWGDDNAVLAYVDMTAANDPSAMTAMTRFAYSPGAAQFQAFNWRDADPSKKTSWYRVETYDDLKQTADCMYIITGCIT